MTTRKITVYSGPACAPCRLLKSRLTKAGIEFEAVDLSEDTEALERLRGAAGAHVQTPVVEVDGVEVMRGFDPVVVRALLNNEEIPNG